MKKFIAFIIGAILTSCILGQNNATLEETIDFLKSKLTDKIGSSTYTVRFDKMDCMLIFKDTYTSKNYEDEWTSYIPLGKLDQSNIEIFESGNIIKLNIYVRNKEKLIKCVRTGDNELEYQNYYQFNFSAISKQNEIPERVKKAFAYAIKLCGGKEDKF